MQKALAGTAIVFAIGALVAAILFFAGVGKQETAAVSFVLIALAATAGVPAFVDRISMWGVPGDHP
jgi:hypothetical protein